MVLKLIYNPHINTILNHRSPLNYLMNVSRHENFFVVDDGHVSTQYIQINKKAGYNTVFETGLSTFHFLIIAEFKISFQKEKPKIITYRNYKAIFQNYI